MYAAWAGGQRQGRPLAEWLWGQPTGRRPISHRCRSPLAVCGRPRGQSCTGQAIWLRRKQLTMPSVAAWRRRPTHCGTNELAIACHQLGVAQDRADLAAAEDWYRRPLAIKEQPAGHGERRSPVRDRGAEARRSCRRPRLASPVARDIGGTRRRPGTTMSYGQLGLLAEARGELEIALDWTIQCIALFAGPPRGIAYEPKAPDSTPVRQQSPNKQADRSVFDSVSFGIQFHGLSRARAFGLPLGRERIDKRPYAIALHRPRAAPFCASDGPTRHVRA